MNEAILVRPKTEDARLQLHEWARRDQLYVLMDPYFEFPHHVEKKVLETKDTDPVFFEVIAWDQVTYEPPYLAKINADTLEWLLNSLSTERWGVFIVSDASLETLVNHYQKFVIARGPDQNPYFLRFHDASVLEVLMNTWEPEEKAVFFGPAIAFGLPDLDTMDIAIEKNPFGARPRNLPLPEDCLIQLRHAQLRQCTDAIDRDLIKVIYWHLRNHHPKCVQFLDKPTLQSRVHHCITKARQYRLGTVSDLAGFAALMFELAPNFDQHPSFKKILSDSALPAEAKMRKLSQVITDREWDEALRLYDKGFWPTMLKRKVSK